MSRILRTIFFPSVCVAVPMLMVSQSVTAAAWDFSPRLLTRTLYTDNTKLQTVDRRNADLVFQLSPQFTLTGNSARIKAKVNYEMHNYFYNQNSESNRTAHQLTGNGNLELVENTLFVEGKANYGQQNTSPLAVQTLDNTNPIANRTIVRGYSVSPYARFRVTDFARAELRYAHNELDTGVVGFAGSGSDLFSLSLASGQAFRRFSWGLNYSRLNSKSSNGFGYDRETYGVNARYGLTAKLSLLGAAGYESNGYFSAAGLPEGAFWNVGLGWTPSSRTMLEGRVGERFYGRNYELNAKHRTRWANLSLGYNESVTNSQQEFFSETSVNTADMLNTLYSAQEPDAEERRRKVQDTMEQYALPSKQIQPINLLTNRVFLQKRLQASVAMSGARNTVTLSAFTSLRTAQTSREQDYLLLGTSSMSALYDETRQHGGNLNWGVRLNSNTSLNMSTYYTRSSFSAVSRESIYKAATVGLNKKLLRDVNMAFSYRRGWQDLSDGSGSIIENAVSASLLFKF